MTRIIQLALAGLCAGLLLVIAAELFQLGNQSVAPSVEVAGSKLGVKTSVPALDMAAAVAGILERPLFNPARRPPEILSAANLGETAAEIPPQLNGRLAGVMIRPGAREALFMRVGQKPIVVKVGGEIDGWKIAAIERDRVILSSDFGTQTVRPTNDPKVVRPAAREMATSMGPPTNSTTRGSGAFAPRAQPPPQSSQVARQVEK